MDAETTRVREYFLSTTREQRRIHYVPPKTTPETDSSLYRINQALELKGHSRRITREEAQLAFASM